MNQQAYGMVDSSNPYSMTPPFTPGSDQSPSFRDLQTPSSPQNPADIPAVNPAGMNPIPAANPADMNPADPMSAVAPMSPIINPVPPSIYSSVPSTSGLGKYGGKPGHIYTMDDDTLDDEIARIMALEDPAPGCSNNRKSPAGRKSPRGGKRPAGRKKSPPPARSRRSAGSPKPKNKRRASSPAAKSKKGGGRGKGKQNRVSIRDFDLWDPITNTKVGTVTNCKFADTTGSTRDRILEYHASKGYGEREPVSVTGTGADTILKLANVRRQNNR